MNIRLDPRPTLSSWLTVIRQHHYSTPVFLLRETLAAFGLHGGLGMSASLSFYALFALIPMALLMFFLLSHLATSSSYAIVKLAILTSNLVPKFSHRIMAEVYNVSKHQAAWGVFGVFALFWAVTPLAAALRSAFYTVAGLAETHSFLRRNLKDVVAVLSILLLFFLFTLSGLLLEKVMGFLRPLAPVPLPFNTLSSLLLCTLLLAAFYHAFFPAKVALRHVLIGSLLTAVLWFAMRPAFSLVLTLNQSFGVIFGGMKNMFISILWLYYSFAVFLLGTELTAVLHKRDVLLLKGLFTGQALSAGGFSEKLMRRFGRELIQGEAVFREGDTGDDIYYLVSGQVEISRRSRLWRALGAGEYFGEMAVLTGAARAADAVVTSEHAQILRIPTENFETLLLAEPKIAMVFLRGMAQQLQQSSGLTSQE